MHPIPSHSFLCWECTALKNWNSLAVLEAVIWISLCDRPTVHVCGSHSSLHMDDHMLDNPFVELGPGKL